MNHTTVALIHHGEKQGDTKESPLTARGRIQARKAALYLKTQSISPSTLLHTQTHRTWESARILSKEFPDLEIQEIEDVPYLWEDWENFIQKIRNKYTQNYIIVCHHPTFAMIKNEFQLKLSLQSFSSVIILVQEERHTWSILSYKQGELALF